ncbi:MAG: hypothetical protein E7588_07500 [Ruminococcaceae bacterium]|nr:hypothetical protein [Oscillospiraceae bacterium]
MKKIVFVLLILLFVTLLFSCNNVSTDQNEQIASSDQSEPEETMLESKFADYLATVVPAKTVSEATYYMEKAITVNGVTTSVITAVKNGKLLTISDTAGVKTVSIVARDTLTSVDVVNKTYTVASIDSATYEELTKNVECMKKYASIEFTPSAYTVVDKDQYAEIAVFDEVPHIYIFNDEFVPKYIVYAQADGALVTEEFITFKAEFDDNIFVLPSDYTQL